MHYFLLERPANLCATRMAAPPTVSPLPPLHQPSMPPFSTVWYVSLCPSRACLQLMPSLTAAWQSLCECHMNFSRLTVACALCVPMCVCVAVCVCMRGRVCRGTDVCCCWRTIFVHLEQLTQFVCALDLTIALPRPHSSNPPTPAPPPPLPLAVWVAAWLPLTTS